MGFWPAFGKQPRVRALSLAELLITLTLVGLFLVPTLLVTSSYLTNQMTRIRQTLQLSHNASLFVEQFTRQISETDELLRPEGAYTAADELRYTYFDPIQQTQRYGGFRLVTVSGRKQLRQLVYENNTWSEVSPFRTQLASAYTLPTSAAFSYCNGNGCSQTPEQATFIRLSGWTFRNEEQPTQSYAMPSLDVYLGSQIQQKPQVLSDLPRLLYTVTTAEAFGTTAVNLRTLAFAENRESFWGIPNMTGQIGEQTIRRASALGTPLHTYILQLPDSHGYALVASARDAQGNLFVLDANGLKIERYYYSPWEAKLRLMGSLTASSTQVNATGDLAVDSSGSSIAVLNGNNRTVYVYSNRLATGSVSPSSSFTVTQNTSPTGFTFDRRNGDYWVVDSSISSGQIRIRRYTSAGSYRGSSTDLVLTINDTAFGAGRGATTETAFKIQLDEIQNRLFLIAPTVGRIYVLALPYTS